MIALLFVAAGIGCVLVAVGLWRERGPLDEWTPPVGGVAGPWHVTGWTNERYAGRTYIPPTSGKGGAR